MVEEEAGEGAEPGVSGVGSGRRQRRQDEGCAGGVQSSSQQRSHCGCPCRLCLQAAPAAAAATAAASVQLAIAPTATHMQAHTSVHPYSTASACRRAAHDDHPTLLCAWAVRPVTDRETKLRVAGRRVGWAGPRRRLLAHPKDRGHSRLPSTRTTSNPCTLTHTRCKKIDSPQPTTILHHFAVADVVTLMKHAERRETQCDEVEQNDSVARA